MIIYNTKDLFKVHLGKKPILVTFPFSGGNSYSYRGLVEHMEDTFDIICTELPGRNSLLAMPLENNISKLVDFVLDTWIPPLNTDCQYIFYGHSMGGLMAFLAAKKIVKSNRLHPSHIVISGRGAPSIARKHVYHNLPSSEFWKKIQEMGGMSEELLRNDDIKEYFEPILRSDFAAVENYKHTYTTPLEVPISVFIGSEENISDHAVLQWQEETTVPVNFHKLTGNHFFIFDHIPEIVSYMKATITKSNLLYSH